MVENTKLKIKPKNWNLEEFYNKRNHFLFYRSLGGLGDMLMHRMMFEDFKKDNPELKILFACPTQYHPALIDHPFLDGVLDYQEVSLTDYLMWVNTSSSCDRYESSIAPLSDKNRSDIWAWNCGVKLTNHNMHITMTDEELQFGKELVEKVRNREGPAIALCPVSAMVSKNLLPQQIKDLVNELHAMNYFVFGLHKKPIETLTELGVPTICDVKVREWMSVIHAADYVISVDTAALHLAGGIKKPLTGIFTWADGYTYTKHYPTVNVVQLHRDKHKELPCCPCYSYGNCPLAKGQIKPCLTMITHQMIMDQVIKMLSNLEKK